MASKGRRSPRAKPDGGDAGSGAPPKIDEVLRELEHVVAELESGELSLEHSLGRFEDGVRLSRQGGAMLDAIEERVEVLLAARGDVRGQIAPFEDDDEDHDGEL